MPDGRIVNEARNAFFAQHGKPERVQEWKHRSPAQQALDNCIAAAVAGTVRPVPEGEVPALLERIRRRAAVWAALPDGEGARFAREILGVLDNAEGDRG